ncbi:MAG: bifunctional hydroxymethylpyrimidine kinase/phosphomethylpyrimidine kinase [Clostridia bacterium]|nr:bifunctional hydroxymethylpyrimidine kinase/phosphomethylpyrimidine kinase [Clostridia bacterium]
MKTVLTIAGSDTIGGAGIQADLKTMLKNGVYGMSVITALTAQNTMGVNGILDVPLEFLEQQLNAVFTDIFPDAVKIGMVPTSEHVEVVAERLKFYKAKNIVTDPVMVATSGDVLTKSGTKKALCEKLFPVSTLVTPNFHEAEVITGIKITGKAQMYEAAKKIYEDCGCSVLLKGGHSKNDANDLLFEKGSFTWIEGEHIENPNSHGTGCTLSSAIASNLANGLPLYESVVNAKKYVTAALSCMLDLGKGRGPMNHGL